MLARKAIKYMTVVVVVFHVLLLVLDGFPFWRIAFSIACHAVYSMLLKDYPYIDLMSPVFISGAGTKSYGKGKGRGAGEKNWKEMKGEGSCGHDLVIMMSWTSRGHDPMRLMPIM